MNQQKSRSLTHNDQIRTEVLIIIIPAQGQHQRHEKRQDNIDKERDQEDLVKKHVLLGTVDQLFEKFGIVKNQNRGQ